MKKITYILFTFLLSWTTISFSQENENNIFVGTWEIVHHYGPEKEMTRKDCEEFYRAERRKISDSAFSFFIPAIVPDGGPPKFYYPKWSESLHIKNDGSFSEYEYPRNFIMKNTYSIFDDTLILENFESTDLNRQCLELVNQNFNKDYKGVLNATQDTLTIFATDYQPKAMLVKKQLDTMILSTLDSTILNPKYLVGNLHLSGYDGWGAEDIVSTFGEDYVLVDSLGSGFPYEVPYSLVITESNLVGNGAKNKIAFEIDGEKLVFEFTYYPHYKRNNYSTIYLKLLDWKDKNGNELELIYNFDR